MLLTKTQNDDKLIDALKRELQFFREKSENADIEKRSPKKTNKRVVTILGQDSTLKQQQEQILRQEDHRVAHEQAKEWGGPGPGSEPMRALLSHHQTWCSMSID